MGKNNVQYFVYLGKMGDHIRMAENFDWKEFERKETARVLSEMKARGAFKRTKPQAAACLNHADEATLKAFKKASSSIIDLFAEKTKNLR